MSSPALNRRDFLATGAKATVALALAAHTSTALAQGESTAASPPRPMKSHRNLFNGDCNFLFYNPELWQPEGGAYSARAIRRYIDVIAQSGIDTLLVNPNTQVVWYPSKKLEYVLNGYRRGDRDFVRPIANGNAGLSSTQKDQYVDQLVSLFDLYLDLTEAKVDWLAECAAACRQRGVSPWLSYRMNPTHYSGAPTSPVNCRLFRDPKNRLSGRIPGPKDNSQAGWVGLNYSEAEVRDHMLTMMREGIEAYDYAGLEMDWLRHPVCVETPASPRQTETMTEWFATVAALGRSRGANFPIGLRVPANLGYLRGIGIDVKTLAQRRIIDFVTFSNFWQTPWEMPLDELRRELGPEVTIYGGMEDAPNWLETSAPSLTERPAAQALQLAGDNAYHAKGAPDGAKRIRGTRYLTASAEFIRANAAGKLVLGADGLEQFNFFVTDQVRVPGQRANYGALRQLTDLAFLHGQPKHYALNTASVQPSKIWDVPEQLPVTIAPNHRRALRLPMCSEPTDTGLELIVQVVTERPGSDRTTGVSFNGAWPVFVGRDTDELLFPSGPYTRHVEEHVARNYRVDLAALRDGWNEITLYNESPQPLNVVAVELAVRAARPANETKPI